MKKIGFLILFLSSQWGQAESVTCETNLAAMENLAPGTLSTHLEACIKFGPLGRFEKALYDSYLVKQFENNGNHFIYFNIAEGETRYSLKIFTNSDEHHFKYYRVGKDNDGKTFLSTRQFKNSKGLYLYYRDKYNSNDLTFLSTKEFSNDKGDFFYLRRKYDADDKTFFSMRRFENTNGKYIYFRNKNDDDATFLSTKMWNNGTHDFIYFRKGKDDDKKTFLSIVDGHVFRDAKKKEIPRGEFIRQLREQFWGPILDKSLRVVSEEVTSRLPDLNN